MKENFRLIAGNNNDRKELKDLVICWGDRNFSNWCLFFVYRFVKVVYITIWCYLAPFLTLVLSYAIPYYLS